MATAILLAITHSSQAEMTKQHTDNISGRPHRSRILLVRQRDPVRLRGLVVLMNVSALIVVAETVDDLEVLIERVPDAVTASCTSYHLYCSFSERSWRGCHGLRWRCRRCCVAKAADCRYCPFHRC